MAEMPSFTCPDCLRTSYNLNDVKNQYCGNCHGGSLYWAQAGTIPMFPQTQEEKHGKRKSGQG